MAPGTSSGDLTPKRRTPAVMRPPAKVPATSTPKPRTAVTSRLQGTTASSSTPSARRVPTTSRTPSSSKPPAPVVKKTSRTAPLPPQQRSSTSQQGAAINGTTKNVRKPLWSSSSQGAGASSKKSTPATVTSRPPTKPANGSVTNPPDSKQDTLVVPMAEAAVQLEAQVTELSKLLQSRQVEMDTLKAELDAMKEMEVPSRVHLDAVTAENATLRARVAQLEAVTPQQLQQRLSDTEKLLLSQQRASSVSAPPSIAGTEPPSPHDGLCSEMLPGSGPGSQGIPGTPDWDHQSLGSEVSVAGLQDRILQMEETHYSTSEELQATLQELADLQAQLTDLQAENLRLTEEKAVVLQSLCRQTERLEDCRARVESLTGLLCTEGLPTPNDTEARLLDLIKGLQEERAEQQSAGEAQVARLRAAQERLASAESATEHQEERVSLLQAQLDAAATERKRLEERLEVTTREGQEKSIEHDRLESVLASARAKIEELEESLQSPGDASALEARLESARAERSELESKVAELQEQLSRAQGEVTRLRDATNSLQEECKVARNNARSQVAELEFLLAREREESRRAAVAASEQAAQSQRHLEGKHQLRAKLCEAQLESNAAREEVAALTTQLEEEKRLRAEENEEWIQFRCDLLMTVRVANDFKTEAQQQLESLILENKALKERNRALDSELTRARAAQQPSPSRPSVSSTPLTESPPVVVPPSSPATADAVFTSMQQEMAAAAAAARRLRGSSSVADNRLSVKTLIESIENATKNHKAGNGDSNCSSESASLATTPGTPPPSPCSQPSMPCPPSPTPTEPPSKSPLRDQQQHNNRSASKKNLLQELVKEPLKSNKTEELSSLVSQRPRTFTNPEIAKDPLWALVRNGGSRRNALLKWCQAKTANYKAIDITNFSSSWNDGMALCALMHCYLPALVPYDSLVPSDKRRNFSVAFSAAESVGIPTTLNIIEMTQVERPDWQQVMAYVTEVYMHFET